MAKVAPELQYSDEHEWVAREAGNVVSIGISAVATDALGDIVYVDLPEVGSTVTAGETCGEVESTKSVSDLYAPVTGEVTEINHAVVDDPSLINSDPYGAGWLFKVGRRIGRPAALRPGVRVQERRRTVSAAAGTRAPSRLSRSSPRAWTRTCPRWIRRSPRRSTPS